MQFTRITGDPLVPRGRVLVTGYLDKEEKNDSVELDANDEGRESSDDNLPWPFPSPTRPIGKTCAGEGQRAFVVSIYDIRSTNMMRIDITFRMFKEKNLLKSHTYYQSQ